MKNSEKLPITKAVQALKRGKSIVFSTETAYGLGVDANNLKAVQQMYAIKQRKNQPTHVLIKNIRMAKQFTMLSRDEKKIITSLMPGAITLIVPLRKNAPSSFQLLSAGTGTIGIRIPDNKIARSLVKKLNQPITASSANPKGGETPYSIEIAQKHFTRKKHKPDFYLDAGTLPRIKPSTIARIEYGKVIILRKGPISKRAIKRAL